MQFPPRKAGKYLMSSFGLSIQIKGHGKANKQKRKEVIHFYRSHLTHLAFDIIKQSALGSHDMNHDFTVIQ
jgi:hypothetical protein